MKLKLQIIATLLAITSLFGCSSGDDVSGKYEHADRSASLTLTKDGKFLHPQAPPGEYTVSGDNITLVVPMVGSIEGEADGNKLVFPKPKGWLGTNMSGTWNKIK